eukprot:SAG22_NODE_1756_length_3651_cov_52.815315_2_plen_91_part_00
MQVPCLFSVYNHIHIYDLNQYGCNNLSSLTAIAMAMVGGGAASEREQTVLGYLAEQSGVDEKEVQAAAEANVFGPIFDKILDIRIRNQVT